MYLVMQQVAKEGYLFLSILSTTTKIDDSIRDWNRRWFKLHTNAILSCYETYSGNFLMKFDLRSLKVLHDEIKWPYCIGDKPFVLFLSVRERGQTILLEADCKECMESWAKLLTQFLPTKCYSDVEHSSTYETMKSREKLNEKPSASVITMQKSGTHRSKQGIYENQSNTLPRLPTKPKPKIKPGYKHLTMNRIASKTPDNTENQPPGNHNYYEIINDSIQPTSSVDSNESDVFYETPDLFPLTGNPLAIESPSSRSENTLIGSNLCQKTEHSCDSKTLGRTLFLSDDLTFLASIPNCQELLDNYWLMCFILPNGKVFTQLVDITLLIECSLKELLKCFTYSHSDLVINLTLKIIGDLHQNFTASRTNNKEVLQHLNWEFSFRSQGVMDSKIIQISLKNDKAVKLDKGLLENFLHHVHHLPPNELFSLSWVSFVKGNFPELDFSVSARHSACIYLIYNRMEGIGKLDVRKFIPTPLNKLPLHLKAVDKSIETYALYETPSLCEVFLHEVNTSRTGNAISLTAKKVTVLKRKIKSDPCILTIGRQHIGIVRSDIPPHYDKIDKFSNLYHQQDIQGWFLIESLEAVAIKLTENTDNDWTKFKIVKTADAMQTVDLLVRDFFQVAKYYSKYVD